MKVKQFEIWQADLNPRQGSEAGKVRPVLIIQSDLLNKLHPSSIICPLTTDIRKEVNILRVNLRGGIANLKKDSAIMIDQIRAIDNRRLLKKVGTLPGPFIGRVKNNLKIVMDLQ